MESDSSTSTSDDIIFKQNHDPSLEQKKSLLKSLHYTVGKIIKEEEENDKESTISGSQKPKMSKDAISCLTEMTFHYASTCLGPDLIAFSKHAKRKSVNVDDVKLVARKNPGGLLLQSLDTFCDDLQQQQQQQQLNFHTDKGGAQQKKKKQKNNNLRMSENFGEMGLTQQCDHLSKVAESSDDESDDNLDLRNHKKPFANKRRKENFKKSSTTTFEINVDSSSSSNSSSGSISVESKKNSNNNNSLSDSDDLDLHQRFQRNKEKRNRENKNSKKNRKRSIILESSSDDGNHDDRDDDNDGDIFTRNIEKNVISSVHESNQASTNTGSTSNDAIEL